MSLTLAFTNKISFFPVLKQIILSYGPEFGFKCQAVEMGSCPSTSLSIFALTDVKKQQVSPVLLAPTRLQQS